MWDNDFGTRCGKHEAGIAPNGPGQTAQRCATDKLYYSELVREKDTCEVTLGTHLFHPG